MDRTYFSTSDQDFYLGNMSAFRTCDVSIITVFPYSINATTTIGMKTLQHLWICIQVNTHITTQLLRMVVIAGVGAGVGVVVIVVVVVVVLLFFLDHLTRFLCGCTSGRAGCRGLSFSSSRHGRRETRNPVAKTASVEIYSKH